MNNGRAHHTGAGSDSTTAVVTGGSPAISDTELWNGTNWTEVNNLNTGRNALRSAGIYTAAIVFGGSPPSDRNATESWNGTNWTNVNNLNTGRTTMGGAGTYTSALGFGGENPSATQAKTEEWNGTNWTETTDLSTARYGLCGAGNESDNSSGFAISGEASGGPTTATEEWTGAGAGLTRTFTDS